MSVDWWIRYDVRHTPAHAVAKWSVGQVQTLCGWAPSGGRVVDADQLLALEAFRCRKCARLAKEQP